MQPPAPLEGLAYYTQSLLAFWPEKAVIGSCVAGVVSLFGGAAYLLWMLGAMLVADFAFGLADAVRRRHFRCRMLAHGALKFPAYCLYLLIVGVVNASLSRSFGGFDMPLLNLFIAYLIITDAVSVMPTCSGLASPCRTCCGGCSFAASGRWSGGWMKPWAGKTMPPRPLKVCRHAGCHELTRDPSGYCPKHKDAAEARARKWKAEQDSQRESAYRRGYGARWRKLRAQILMDEPLCRECRKAGRIVPATDVDHIVARADGGTDDRSNLQPLCHACHSRKTVRENGGRAVTR